MVLLFLSFFLGSTLSTEVCVLRVLDMGVAGLNNT